MARGVVADVVLLVVVVVFLIRVRPGEEDFWFSDASRHALDGVFLLDVLRDGGFVRPYEYAASYHARLPALGVAYYPPFFACVEACAYLAFGTGYLTARGTVIFFGVIAVVAAYALGRRLDGRATALVAPLALFTMPTVVYWARDVMLELPAIAMVLLTVLFLQEWVDQGKRWAAYACAFSAVAAVLTKQPTAFVIPLIPIYVLARRRPSLLWSKDALICAALALAVLVPYVVFQSKVYPHAFRRGMSGGSGTPLADYKRWLFLFRELPELASWPICALALVGGALSVWQKGKEGGALLVAWFAVGYLFTAYAIPQLPRYLYLLMPSVAFLAAYGGVSAFRHRARSALISLAVVALAIGYQSWRAVTMKVPRVSDGIKRAAEWVAKHPRGETVLYHGYLSGNFVYHMRVADGRGGRIVLRSDKLFGKLKRLGEKHFSPSVETGEQVAQLLERHGVGHVVIEPGDCSEARRITPLLMKALSGEPWVLKERIPLSTAGIRPINGDILVYENGSAGAATADAIPLWIPLSNESIEVPYADVRRWGRLGDEH